MEGCLEILGVASAPQEEAMDAIKKDSFQGFEDCLQDKCVKEAGADFTAVCKTKDFVNPGIPALTPKAFPARFE